MLVAATCTPHKKKAVMSQIQSASDDERAMFEKEREETLRTRGMRRQAEEQSLLGAP